MKQLIDKIILTENTILEDQRRHILVQVPPQFAINPDRPYYHNNIIDYSVNFTHMKYALNHVWMLYILQTNNG
jgi:hypothetical protein